MKRLLLLAFLLLACSLCHGQAYQLPNNNAGCPANCRQIPWSAGSDLWNAGTLPTYTSVICTGLVGNGITNDGPAIQTCINNASTNTAVFIPAGTYLINSLIRLKSNVVLRGAGVTQTFLNEGASGNLDTQNFSFTSGGLNPATNFNTIPSTFALSGTPQKGDTSVTITSGAPNIGDWIQVYGNDDPSIITTTGDNGHCNWCGNNTGFYVRQQIVQVTNKVGSVLTLSRPLYYPLDTTSRVVPGPSGVGTVTEPAGAKYTIIAFGTQKAGFENFKVTATVDNGGSQIIRLQGCLFCWVKGVETQNTGSNSGSAHIEVDESYGCEIRDSYVHDGRSSASGANYGIYFQFSNSDHKVENNIMRHNRHGFVFQGGGSGVAFLYNYIDDLYTDDLTYLGSARTSHGAHPFFDLWEGNIMSHVAADSFWGTTSHDVFFRNSMWGDETGTGVPSFPPNSGFDAIDTYPLNTYYAFVGNVLGRTGLHTTWSAATLRGFNEFAAPATPIVYSYGGTQSGIPSTDTTSLNHGNWDFKTNGVAYWEGGTNHVLANSLYYTTKPAFLGNISWPLIGPDVTGGNLLGTSELVNENPAELCYLSGTFNPAICYAAAPPPFVTYTFVTYNGADLVLPGTAPNLGGATNNKATVFDSSYLGHINTDGTTFSNAAFLSPITRVTDILSAKTATDTFTAGQGGAGNFPLTNLDTSLIGITDGGQEFLCRFQTVGTNKGFCNQTTQAAWFGTYQPTGIFISTGQKTGGSCVTNCPLTDFGSIEFSHNLNKVVYTFGTSTEYTNPTAVFTTTVEPATGQYTVGATPLVDFAFGLPAQQAANWIAAHSYNYGDYVIHPLAAGEMATSGVWATGHIYALGDIVTAQGGTIQCMYKAVTASGLSTTGSSPAFLNTSPCKTDTLTDAVGNKWQGTNSTAKFIYQKTSAGTQTSGSSFTISGHPDTLSTVTDSSIAWTNVGTAYVPINGNQLWQAAAGIDMGTSYIVGGVGYATRYGVAMSTNSYGALSNNYKFTAGQDTGFWWMEYDETLNIYHLLNTGTGIWTDYTCSAGTGYNCSGGTWVASVIGTLKAITDPFATGTQACPYYLHDAKMAVDGLHQESVTNSNFISACNAVKNFEVWRTTSSLFNQYASLQVAAFGMAHWAIDKNTTVAESSSGWGFTKGVYIGVYSVDNVSGSNGNPVLPQYPAQTAGWPPPFSYYLPPQSSQSNAQSTPPGSYVTVSSVQKNPDADLSEVFGSHVSRTGLPGTDTGPACGTTYNLNPANGLAINMLQNEETCFSTLPLLPSGYVPNSGFGSLLPLCFPGGVGGSPACAQTYGSAWRFSHTWATQASVTFSTQFQISEYSQDGNWMFYSSDHGCTLGSTLAGNAVPMVWTSGTHVQMLAVAALPANPSSLCGYPWQAATLYTVGNLINPIEGTSGSAQIDDVFQAIFVNGNSGPQSTLTSHQPKCGSVSCFATTSPPTISTAGDTVCDSTSGSANSINPPLPYSTSCPNGVVWQDLGPQTQRGDVFAVRLIPNAIPSASMIGNVKLTGSVTIN